MTKLFNFKAKLLISGILCRIMYDKLEQQEAILWAMDRASKYIYIAVNEYLPMDVYKKNHYWPVIDERILAGTYM